ncbi:MAG: lysylphosphatidylglycerol synthase transmembrane domain-containing protein [Gammaproteobacteria bacterium]
MAISPQLFRQFVIWLAISIAIYGIVLAAMEDVGRMTASLASLGLAGWVVVISLSSLNIALRFLRWQYYLVSLGHKISRLRSLQCFIAGFAFTITPAKAGEAVRSLYLKNDGIPYTNSLAALFVERLTDLLAVVLMALAAAYSFADYRWLVWLAGGMTLAILPLIHSKLMRHILTTLSERFADNRLGGLIQKLVNLIDSSATLLRSGPLYGGMILSLIACFSVCMMMYVALNMLGSDISLPLAVGIYATGILVGALSFLPGGIGSAEAVMIGLLILAGTDLATATAVTLICRIAALWYSIALGFGIVLRLETTSAKAKENG